MEKSLEAGLSLFDVDKEEFNDNDLEQARNKAVRGETRRVQMTGGSTLVVSLPRDWVKSVGIKAKDEVFLAPQTDMSLLITHRSRIEKASESSIEVSSHMEEGEVLRTFIAYYIGGFDIVRIKFRANLPEIRSNLKTHIRDKLIGVEIVEETSDAILAQCLHGYFDLPVKKAQSRMGILTSAMQIDAVRSLLGGDPLLAKEILERDDEVDRFYHFIARQLNLAVHNRMMIQEIGLVTAQDCLNYRLVVKSIERIADHAAQVANSTVQLEKRRIPQALGEHIQKLSKLTNEIFESALRAVHGKNSKIANETIARLCQVLKEEESATQELVASRLDNSAVVSLRLAIESLRRIAEYSVDICEIVVNLNIGSPF